MADSQPQKCLPCFPSWSQHQSSITGLLSTSAGSMLISSSMDGTCKVWDLVIGVMLQSYLFSRAVTAMVLDPGEQLLFSGCEDGRIHIHALDIGLQEIPPVVLEDQSKVLHGHKESITALSFSTSGLWLISASEDSTACLWDVSSWQITRRFNHRKGRITNLVTIPLASLSAMESQRNTARFRVSLLEKAPLPTSACKGTITLLPTHCSLKDHHNSAAFRSSNLLNQHILDLERGRTPEAIQMKVKTNVENRLWAVSTTKHMTAMNKHLQSRLLDLLQHRLFQDVVHDVEKTKKPTVDHPEHLQQSGA